MPRVTEKKIFHSLFYNIEWLISNTEGGYFHRLRLRSTETGKIVANGQWAPFEGIAKTSHLKQEFRICTYHYHDTFPTDRPFTIYPIGEEVLPTTGDKGA